MYLRGQAVLVYCRLASLWGEVHYVSSTNTSVEGLL